MHVSVKLLLVLSMFLVIFIAGCDTTGYTVAVRSGSVDNNMFKKPAECVEGWRCERGESFYQTEYCEKRDILVCRDGCSDTEDGKCAAAPKKILKEVFRFNSSTGKITDIPRVRVNGTVQTFTMQGGEAVQLYYAEDDWYIVRVESVNRNTDIAVFSIDDEMVNELGTRDISHHKGLFIRVKEMTLGGVGSRDKVTFDVGKTPR